jgi:hypothetical protein
VVVCPWPPGLPPPEERGPTTEAAAATTPEELARARFHAGFRGLRRTLGRLGVPLLCAQGDDPARHILDRLERLRIPERTR